MEGDCVRRALALLEKARRMDLVNVEALSTLRPASKASQGVAAVLACSPPCSGQKTAQVRKTGWVPGRAVGRDGGAGGFQYGERPSQDQGRVRKTMLCITGAEQKDDCGERPGKGLGAAFTLLPQGNGSERGGASGLGGVQVLFSGPPRGPRIPLRKQIWLWSCKGAKLRAKQGRWGP
ncbi:hypothetical protein NDU88_010414 [Pleurodeles waltl]|uniref:Uncharacterized protein n=1 Tax=Pleurodeles waltl TaxID=8319 RepID=A0AAV7PXZ3_PLEWA|nr:hypothetical protein NDU88_010414 [Pleurodeles waltl]